MSDNEKFREFQNDSDFDAELSDENTGDEFVSDEISDIQSDGDNYEDIQEENDDIFGFGEEDDSDYDNYEDDDYEDDDYEDDDSYSTSGRKLRIGIPEFVVNFYGNNKKKVIKNTCIICAVLLLVILVVTDIIPILPNAYHRYYVGNTYTIGETQNCIYDKLGDNVLYVGSGALCIFGPDMGLEYRKEVHSGIPVMRVNSDNAVVYFRNTGEYMLVNDSGAKDFTIEEKVISASVSENGYYTIVTDVIAGHNACVSAYSPEGKVIYEWFTNYNVIDSAISSDGTHMIASVFDPADGAMTGKLVFFDLSKSSPVEEVTFDTDFVFELYSVNNGRFIGFGQYMMVAYTFDGKEIWKVDYEDKNLITYDISDEENIAMVFDTGKSGNNESVLEIYNFDGKNISSYASKETIRSISANNKHCLLTFDDNTILINNNGKVKKYKDMESNFSHVVLYENYNFGFTVHDGISETVSVNH